MPAGVMRFIVPDANRVNAGSAELAYMTGLDMVPWTCRSTYAKGVLSVERPTTESGRLHIPWDVPGRGQLTLTTSMLLSRNKPYILPVELARGTLNMVRNQAADWQSIGLIVSILFEAVLREASKAFGQAATRISNPEEASVHAELALAATLEAADLLTISYVEQATTVRRRPNNRLLTLLGIDLGSAVPEGAVADKLCETFHLATVPFNWKSIESKEGEYDWKLCDAQVAWCQQSNRIICGGPLLRLDHLGLPDWLWLWSGDFDNLLSFASDYIETVVGRYRDRVKVWHCAARADQGHVLSLTEEQRLQLTVRAVEVTKRVSPGTPVIVRMDQPWAEYMRKSPPDLSPLHFADALIRAGVPVDGLAIELNLGYFPGGSYLRHRLEINRLIDLWSYLGLPLHVIFVIPSSDSMDPNATEGIRVMGGCIGKEEPLEFHRQLAQSILPVILAKPAVQSITWGQYSDGVLHEFPHGGLIDSSGSLKPCLQSLSNLRRQYLD